MRLGRAFLTLLITRIKSTGNEVGSGQTLKRQLAATVLRDFIESSLKHLSMQGLVVGYRAHLEYSENQELDSPLQELQNTRGRRPASQERIDSSPQSNSSSALLGNVMARVTSKGS